MNAIERDLFRNNLLHQLDKVAPSPLPVPQLKVGARIMGFNPSDQVIDAELLYLSDKGLVMAADKVLSPENKYWRITAIGRDHVAANPIL